MINLFKLSIARGRWGALSRVDSRIGKKCFLWQIDGSMLY